jgi:hypothetical protein
MKALPMSIVSTDLETFMAFSMMTLFVTLHSHCLAPTDGNAASGNLLRLLPDCHIEKGTRMKGTNNATVTSTTWKDLFKTKKYPLPPTIFEQCK